MVNIASALDELKEEMAAMFACACLMHGNRPKAETATADVVFLPGLAVDNWQETTEDDGILSTAADLSHAGRVGSIAIPGYEGTRPQGSAGVVSTTGYPGGAVWEAELLRLGVPPGRVLLYAREEVGPDGKSWNTRTEIDDFVCRARERGLKDAFVVATPFHLLRVMLTLVKALSDAKYRMRLRAVTLRSVSWAKLVYHSQGAEQLPRHEHIAREWSRILEYQRNGSMCTFHELRERLVHQLSW